MAVDHDGVLVDIGHWDHKTGDRAVADIDVTLDPAVYRTAIDQGLRTWTNAREARIVDSVIDWQRNMRDRCYQEYRWTAKIDIDRVIDVTAAVVPSSGGDRDNDQMS